MKAVEAALKLHRRGLSVIPVPRPRGGVPDGSPGDGKTPALKWKPYQERRATEEEIRAWFATPQNIAVITGAVSGVVVVDADSDEGLDWCRRHLFWTPWQVRTGRGTHLYYRHPGSPVTNKARVHTPDGRVKVDVRGDGGLAIAPGSLHRNGSWYRPAGDWSVDKLGLPPFDPAWIARPEPKRQPRQRTAKPTGDVVARARAYLSALDKPVIGAGSHNDTFYAAARLTRGFDLPEKTAEELIWEWAGDRPGWTREWVADMTRSAAVYGTEPVGAYR